MEELTVISPEVDDLVVSDDLCKVDAGIESAPGHDLSGSLIEIGRPADHIPVSKVSSPAVRALDHLSRAAILDGVETIARFDANEYSCVVVEIPPDLTTTTEALQVDEVTVGVVVLLRAVADSHGCLLSLTIM